MASFESLQQRLHEFDCRCPPELAAAIETAAAERRDQVGHHADWSRLCERAGLFALAFRELQLAVRDDPNDLDSAFRLAGLYRERGDAARAIALLERLHQAQPTREDWLAAFLDTLVGEHAQPKAQAALDAARRAGLAPERARSLAARLHAVDEDPPPAAPDTPTAPEDAFAPTDADCIRFVTLFAGREDVYARQWIQPGGNAGYSPIREPFTPAVARNHILGNHTVGSYPIRLDGTATWFALDLDIDRSALERAHGDPQLARTLRDAMRAEGLRLLGVVRTLGFTPLFEDSGYKGRHLWVFLDQPEDADILHFLGSRLLAWQSPNLPRGLHLEFFPKQGERTGKGLGNLIKLPLGIHRRTGRRSLLLDDQGRAAARPLVLLREVQRTSRDALYAAIEQLKALAPGDARVPATGAPPGAPAPAARPIGPTAPAPPPGWTEADFEADPAMRHMLHECPVLAELKRTAEEHRRLTHEEQLTLVHTLGHVEGGPLAVNWILAKCVDVSAERFMKDRLKGNPVSCPSIRKKVPHVTRRVSCNCLFEFARDRYPTPLLHLLTLKKAPPAAPPPAGARSDVEHLARRFAVLDRRRRELDQEWQTARATLMDRLRFLPERALALDGGRYRLAEAGGVTELQWDESATPAVPPPAAPATPPSAPGEPPVPF